MIRRIGFITALLLGLFAVQKIVATEIGDANGDGVVNVADIIAVVNAANGQESEEFDRSAADMNGDGAITAEDIKLIVNKMIRPDFDLSNAFIDDYERAFVQGYLAKGYYYYDRKQQITSQEFKAMLKPLVEKYSPDKMEYFNSRISDVDIPITRSIAVGMAYYAAYCIGVLKGNSPYNRSTYDDLWNNLWDNPTLSEVLPYGLMILNETDPEDMISAALQNADHVSIVSNKEIVEYYLGKGWLWNDAFTWEEAIRAITRLYDSFEPEIEYVCFDDPRVTSPDATIITPELITKAAEKEIHNIEDLPWLFGFQCGEGNTGLQQEWRFNTGGKDIKEWASWGFNSVKYIVSWRYFFDNDLKANLSIFKSLDEMVAAAMESGVHLCLTMCALPGCGAYWADNIRDDYIMDNDILNEEKREKCRVIWRTIATRYKDVPNANLSFQPISEILGLYESSSFGEGERFTVEQINDYHDIMIDAIREISPERFIFYDALYNPSITQSGERAVVGLAQYNHMSEKYKNTRQARVWMDMAYMFYEYNTGDGNIDWAHHSVWVPTYPITLYGGSNLLMKGGNETLTIDGCLPKGTVINFYIADAADATMNIATDGNTLYEEAINGDFNMGYAMASGEPFRKSDKLVSVTLYADAKEVTLSANSGAFNWCGIEIVLPESYTVERWWKPSAWDVELGWITEEEASQGWIKKATSTAQIGSTDDPSLSEMGLGLHLTVHEDATITSDYIYGQSNKDYTELLVKENCESAPNWSARFEDILVTDMAGALNYWDETLDVFKKNHVDCWVSAIGLLSEEQLAPYRICDYEGEDFEGHHNFNVKLLRILQKYMDK